MIIAAIVVLCFASGGCCLVSMALPERTVAAGVSLLLSIACALFAISFLFVAAASS